MTKMIRLPVGGDQVELSPPDLTTENGIEGENICNEIPSLRESAPKPTMKMQESSTTTTTPTELEVLDQDVQNQRRTSHRLLTANRNDTVSTTSTLSSSRSNNHGQGAGNMRNSEQMMSIASDPSSTSVICSLPLNRLETMLGMLNVMKKNHDLTTDHRSADAVSSEQDQNTSSSAGSDSTHDAPNDHSLAYKVLCLYCDRSFSSQKLMIKHTDRIHRIAKDRRSSARVLSTTLNGSDVSTCCHFCHKSKTLNLVSENLPELFRHLISVHSDRYYACEHCTLRFTNDEAREAHMEALHPSTNSGRPKSKAALKAFSHGQNCTLHHPQPIVSVVNCKAFKTTTVPPPDATEPSSMPLELSSKTMDRLVLNNSVNNSSTKGESAVQNICLRSSLRNATALAAQKDTESGKSKTKAFKKSERLLRRNSEPMLLSRLGITQHRLPRQSRRLLAAASTNANASLLSSDTLSASSTLATTSMTASCLSKFTTKKKGLMLSNDEVQPVQNCYNKITKLKTIRSTLSTTSMAPVVDETTIETIQDSGKASGKGSDGTANGGTAVTSTGPISDLTGGLNNRGAMNNSSLTANSIWGSSSTGGISSNVSNGNTPMPAASSGVFDEDFYETVTRNVKNNLSCHLDGKLEAPTPCAPSPMSPVSVVPAVRSTVVKSPISTDSKIHEATNLPAVSVMFPTLLTVEQYGTDMKPTTNTAAVASVASTSSVKTKKPITKNSWKWKWDFVKKYKYVNENGRIVKKIKQPTIGLRDLSKLDMWTQLTMRTKHELFQHGRSSIDDQRQEHASSASHSTAKAEPLVIAEVGATLRHEKRAMVEQLDHILDARLLPHIDLEQNDQRIIKIEPSEELITKEETMNSSTELMDDKDVISVPPVQCSSLVPWSNHSNTHNMNKNSDFLNNLQLIQLNRHYQHSPVVLSGEWARPRCYICYGCGAKFNSLKQVEEHRIFRHPHVHSTFYEIVGRELIEKRLYKHFFIPVIALMMHRMHCMRLGNPERIMNSAMIHGMNPQHAGVCRITVGEIKNEDSSSNEATSFSTSTSASSSSSSRHSTNTTVTTLMDTCSDAMNVLTQCSALAIDEDDEGNSVGPVICSKCQKECQNQILLYAHILHCSNDYVWLQAKKRMKYRRAKRRRGGNRSGASCAPTILTIPRMVQPQQNVVEKMESTGYVSLSSSVDETHGLNGVVASNTSLNSTNLSSNLSTSSDSTCGSSLTSNNSSVNSNDLSKVKSSQKVRRSPKPKENDSDIVKKLLANLPAKRNSRQTSSPSSKQINKRSRVAGRKNFCSTTASVTSKQVTKLSSLLLGESVVTQPSSDDTTPVHNGNNNDSNKDLSTSSISSTKLEKISHNTASTKLRTRQGFSSSATSGLPVSPNKTQKTTCKKASPSSEDTTNGKRSSKESTHILEKGTAIRKKQNKKRGKLVGTINKNKMLLWKKGQKHPLVRLTTTNGHHRMLRSSGKRLLPTSASIRQPSVAMRSMRHSPRGKNVSKNKILLKKQKQTPSVVVSRRKQEDTLIEMESTTIEDKDNTGIDAAEKVTCNESSEQIASDKIDSSLEAEALVKVTDNSTANEKVEQTNVAIAIEQTVDNMEPLAGSRKTSSESNACPHSAIQVTPNQPIKKQYSKDPPATPAKCNPAHAENSHQSLSTYSAIVEHNEPPGSSGSQSTGGCKRRKKKLNDCIAMLTGKLSERLGVDFFNNEKNIEEASQTQSPVSCSTTKLTTPNTTTSSCSVSSDECSNFTKHKEVTMLKAQNVPKHSSLPSVAPNNNYNTSSAVSEQSDVSSSTSSAWSNDSRQALAALPLQTAPVRLKTVNSVRSLSPNLATPLTFERLTTQIESATEQIPDEPLNLSKNSPIGRGMIRAHTKAQWKLDNASSSVFKPLHSHQESSILATYSSTHPLHAHHLKAENLACHLNHSQGTSKHTNQHKTKCTSPPMADSGSTIAPKMGAGNFSSLKLPPGLIIERVEYKQSRPSITKEIPSVTIVARQRQLPAPELIPSINENSATDLTIEKNTSIMHSSGKLLAFANNSSNFAKPLANSTSGLIHHSDPNHTKILGYGNYSEPNVLPRRSEPSTDNAVTMCMPSVLRSGPCVENRISVTITESNSTVHERIQDVQIPTTSVDLSTTSQKDKMVSSYCSQLRKSPLDSTQMRAPQRTSSSVTSASFHKTSIGTTGVMHGSSEKTPPPITTLIIPQVPMPPLSSQTIHPIKRARRKSIFVPLPVPTDESSRDVMAKPLRQQHSIIPTITASPSTLSGTTGITSANLLASMSLSFIAPGLLPVPGSSMLGPIDMQRLAAVRLPAHLQPPVIPPLKIPDASASATLLEKIFHPTHSDALSTTLELKTDGHCNQPKQPISIQPAATRSNMYHNIAEENAHFISSTMATSPNINGFVNQSEQVSKIHAPPPSTKLDGIRATDTKMKSNSSSATSKGSGRILKRRASVADLQRKALMEQIWNQSIIDKMMHEKDARIISGLEETQKVVKSTTSTAEIVIEENRSIEKIDERTTRKEEHVTTISEKPNVHHSSVSSCAPNGNKTEPQNKKGCLLEIDLMSAETLKVPENISKTILHHNVEELQQHNTAANSLHVQEEKEIKLQHNQKEYNVQLKNKQDDSTIPLTQTIDKLNGSNATLEQNQHIKETDLPAPLSSINAVDMIKTVDKIATAAPEDGAVDIVDCEKSVDTQKTTSKKIVRKRRKNELASILSDQLLESFKEVDKSRLDDLKLLHDLTCETPDVKFTLEQIPQLAKRKSNPRLPELTTQESSKMATTANTTTKKVQNPKRQAKEKEVTSQSTVKEVEIKSTNPSFGSSESYPHKEKGVQIQEREVDSISESINDLKDKCTQKAPSGTQESIEMPENSTKQGLAIHKTTRSKTQTTLNGEHILHNTSRKSSTRLTYSALNSDVDTERTDIINIEDSKSLSRKLTSTPPAEEILQTCEQKNSTNTIDDVDKVNSLTTSNARLKEITSDKSTDTPVAAKATFNPPKRIMSRRKSVFVDCDLAQYVEKEEEKLKKESTSLSFKDDLMLTPRRGTRSQGQLGLDLMDRLVEATMKPRDPRRRMLQKRREEELNDRENKLQLQLVKNGSPAPVEKQTVNVVEKQMEAAGSNALNRKEKKVVAIETDSFVDTKFKTDKEISFSAGIQEHAPLRRISARRSSVCVRSLTDSQNVKGTVTVLPEDDHLRDIGNEVKRIYKRRASIYQPPTEEQHEDEKDGGKQHIRQENLSLNSKVEVENRVLAKKKETIAQKSHNRRSKTPGPGDWKRRNQLPLNGTAEPLIESLLLHAPDSQSNAPKRRTTKNSQIAETVSKLFNIQEEIMLIDSSRRKPRKVNLPTISTQPESSNQEQHKETLESTNEGTEIEKGNEKSNAFSSYDLSNISNEVIEKKSPPHMPRKSFSFSNDEDESPKAIKKLVENIISNTTNSSNASTDYSDDDNMSLACFAARSNVAVANSEQPTDMFAKPPLSTVARAMSVIADDESTTNTDALDDDMMSVTTEIPTSTNISRMGNRRVRRKRRKSRRQNNKVKRQQTKTQEENNKPVQSFNCTLCRKMFKKQDAYNKHRMTLSHIAKLSEQEYLVSQQNQERRQNDPLQVSNDNMQLQLKPNQEVQDSQRTEKIDESNANSMYPSEVIPTTHDDSMSITVTDKSKLHDDQAVKELSQEEKLFFECCSMLKESNSGESVKLKRVTVSLKPSDLLNSTDAINPCLVLTNAANPLSATDASVHLPLIEQNQTLPVSTACCVEEFVATQVTDMHQENSTYPQSHGGLGEAANFLVQRYVVANEGGNVSPHHSIKSSSTMPTATGSSISSNSSSSSSTSSSSSSSSDSNNVSKNNANNSKIKTKGALKGYDNFKVSIPMTGLTVMSTNTANTGVGVGKESRLDTLADVALCGDIPKEFGIAVQSDEINAATLLRVDERSSTCQEALVTIPVSETDMFIDEKVYVHSVKLLENKKKDCNSETKTNPSIPRACEQNNAKSMSSTKIGSVKNRECSTKSQNKPSTRWITGPYRRKTEKNNPPPNAEAALQCDHTFLYEGDDVYAFQDSPCDGDLPSSYSSKKNSNTMHNQSAMKNYESSQQHIKKNSTVTTTLEEHEDSQMSSLSFSDRDDFVYGTNTMSEEEEEEEDKNSSISSEQTTPKKLTNADVQKKSLIMGRIFKKGGAKDKLIGDTGLRKCTTASPAATPVTEVPHKVAGAAVATKATTVKSTVKDFDKLFDTLKNDAVLGNEQQNSNEPESDIQHTGSCGEEIHLVTMGVKDILAEHPPNNSDHSYHPGHKNLEKIDNGTERLRRRRTGQQKNLTETWDSDEFEDFQTDDIMRLIDRTEDDEINDNTLSKKRLPSLRTTQQKEKSGNLECISTDGRKQTSALNNNSNNEKEYHRIELDKHVVSKKGIHSLIDKKPSKSDTTVTDDTIRKVMESVILETMGKSCNINKRKPTALNTDSTAASNTKALLVSSNSGNVKGSFTQSASPENVSLALELTSLEEHKLESSVVISSKTITSKFKQKLNSSMRNNLVEVEDASNSNEKEPISRQSKSVADTSTLSNTNPGINAMSVSANSKNNNNNKNISNNNNNSKLSAKSSKVVTGNKSKVKPKSTEEEWIGKTPVVSGKQRRVAPKKMKNIAYDPDSDYEQSIKCKKVKRKLLENDIEANLKIEQLQSTLQNAEDSSILLTTSRRKRNAGDMLYYWSSSSDEEIEKEEKTSRTKRHGEIIKNNDRSRHCKPINNNNVPVGKKRGRKKKPLESTKSVEHIIDDANKPDVTDSEKDETIVKNTSNSSTTETSLMATAKKSKTITTATDKKIGVTSKTKKQLDTEKSSQMQTLPVQTDEETCGTSSEHLQQHGWIMGDSHKKLVTMLAHAKGKHDSRKQSTTIRKK